MARFDQCTETCTTDCGHCKGRPVEAMRAEIASQRTARERAETEARAGVTLLVAAWAERDVARLHFGEALADRIEVEAERDTLTARLESVDGELRNAGIEYPLGVAGVHDLASTAMGRLEDLRSATVQLAEAEKVIRAETLKITARALLTEAAAYRAKWCDKPNAVDWDKGHASGIESAAHTVANSIDRPEVITEASTRAETSNG